MTYRAPSLCRPDHPVLQVLHDRRTTGSRPGRREDPHKVGLAVEGGTMRGVVSCGMLAALSEEGFDTAFDAVYGCSAGALNGAYFVAGGVSLALSVYLGDLTSGRFVSLPRGLRGGSVIDLPRLFADIIDTRKALDYSAVLESPVTLGVAITLADEAKPLVANEFGSRDDLREALMCSSWHPLGVKGTGRFRGMRAIDGAILMPLPFRSAMEDGCTHVLSLSTYPIGVQAGVSRMHRFTARRLRSVQPGLGPAYIAAVYQKISDLDWLAAERTAPTADGRSVLDLAMPHGTATVSRWERNVATLARAAEQSRSLVKSVLSG